MFAPHHQDVADELVRVCRPAGTIGLLSWTPEGMMGALFRRKIGRGQVIETLAFRRKGALLLRGRVSA